MAESLLESRLPDTSPDSFLIENFTFSSLFIIIVRLREPLKKKSWEPLKFKTEIQKTQLLSQKTQQGLKWLKSGQQINANPDCKKYRQSTGEMKKLREFVIEN